ncbi:MAG TPA: hypothetical protein VNT75_14155, partial [Symbiobacteriaceae bacterium]|nr:hypothetical protein [Symbiobacteriaceae bacterium]
MRFLIALVAVVLVGATWGRPHVASAAIPGDQDQSQTVFSDYALDTMSNTKKWAQTFKPSKAGKITGIKVWLRGTTTTTTVTLTLYANDPGGTAVPGGSQTVSVSNTADDTASWREFVFAAPVTVTNTTYAFVLTQSQTQGTFVGFADGTNLYPDGINYVWNGTSWDPFPTADVAFVTYMEPNQAPTLATNLGVTVNEGATATINDTKLKATDLDGDT